jgi:hypothetical protein
MNIKTCANKTFSESKIFNKLHTSSLLDARLELLLNALKNKYGISYIAVHVLDETSDYIISYMGHDNWHNYIGSQGFLNIPDNSVIAGSGIPQAAILKENENYFLFFQSFITEKSIDLRAEFFGETKKGCSVIFHNNKNKYKTQFCFTFIKDRCITTIDKKIFFSLMNDLSDSKELLDSFMIYFKQTGNILDTFDLEKTLQNNPFKLKF